MMMIPQQEIASCSAADCELLVNPIPRPKVGHLHVTARPRRRSVAMIDNGKPNSMVILCRAREILRGREIEVAERIHVKRNVSLPVDDTVLDQLAETGGLILSGVSDCGSCSLGSSLDALLLQQRGAAGVAVLTQPFGDVLKRVTAYHIVDQPLPVVVLDHPMQNIEQHDIEARAQTLASAVVRFLS